MGFARHYVLKNSYRCPERQETVCLSTADQVEEALFAYAVENYRNVAFWEADVKAAASGWIRGEILTDNVGSGSLQR